jgi:hypothetical protein
MRFLAAAVLCSSVPGLTLPSQEPSDPAADFARAEELACAGRHREARRAYERLAELHPTTPEGKLATVRSLPSALLGACMLVDHGPPANRVEIVLLGDGYEIDHQRAFDELAEDVPPLFERVEPFREYWSYFNFVRGVSLSADAGVDGFGREYDTLLGGFTLGTDAGHVAIDGRRAHDVLAQIPGSDGFAIVFVKLGVLGTGGDGLAVIGGRDARIAVHEWGHAFGGLGDEYSDHTHRRGLVGDRVNVSSSEDPKLVPWRHWLEARHPSVGIHEGASGQVMGAWRPTASGCIMNDGEAFCPPCREALVLSVYEIVDPIEEVVPPAPPAGVREPVVLWEDPVEFRVRTMQPATHDLEVSWWVEPWVERPITPAAPLLTTPAPPLVATRRDRGALQPRSERPLRNQGVGQDGVDVLRLKREDFEPGRYRVTCRVRDTAEPRGERFAWVLRDDHGLLESERVWWLEVR